MDENKECCDASGCEGCDCTNEHNLETAQFATELTTDNEHYAIVHIEGGLGKNILATAFVEVIKKTYPNSIIIVVSPWEDVWINNPHISRVYKMFEAKYFKRDYIQADTKIFRMDPYLTEDHILQRKHLLDTWCSMYGMKYEGEQPRVHLTPREVLQAQNMLNKQADPRPVLIIQVSGGATNAAYTYSWTRDIPIQQAQTIANIFNANGYRVLQIRDEKQIQLQNTETLHQVQPRQLFALIALSDKRFFNDSFAHHAAAAFNLKSTVCWIKTNPNIFGYDLHNNIVTDAKEVINNDKDAYLFDYDFNGPLPEYPFETLEIFNIEKIVKSIENN